jgi:hypothetical protein
MRSESWRFLRQTPPPWYERFAGWALSIVLGGALGAGLAWALTRELAERALQ